MIFYMEPIQIEILHYILSLSEVVPITPAGRLNEQIQIQFVLFMEKGWKVNLIDILSHQVLVH